MVDPWIALAAVALATERIRFGPLVTAVPRRRPWKLARETATLDVLSNGRLVLGVGLGWPAHADFDHFGEDGDDRRRARLLDEGLAIVDGLWSGEPFSFDGQEYRMQETVFLPRPTQRPRPPVWVAAHWPKRAGIRRAARWDGVFPELIGGGQLSPDQLAEIVGSVAEQRAGIGITAPFDVVVAGRHRELGSSGLTRLRKAGATWWLESIGPTVSGTEALGLAAPGPPR